MSESKTQPPPGTVRKLLYGVIVALLALVWLEGLLNLLWLIPGYRHYKNQHPPVVEFKEETFSRHDPYLGWNHIPGTKLADFFGAGRDVTINAEGFRGPEIDLSEKPADRYRLAILGDSFTFGYGVGDEDAYPAILGAINPDVQVVNMGQCGYSVGQGSLWYRQRAGRLDADMLILALITDDIWRMAGKRTANGYGQPVFRLENETVTVANQPVPEKLETGTLRFGRHQAIRYFVEQNAVLRTLAGVIPDRVLGIDGQCENALMAITLALIGKLNAECEQNQRAFAVVLLPELNQFTDAGAADAYEQVARILGDYCYRRGVPFLDMRPHFKTQGPLARRFFLDEVWHHYAPAGHRFVANRLHGWLRDVVPDYPH